MDVFAATTRAVRAPQHLDGSVDASATEQYRDRAADDGAWKLPLDGFEATLDEVGATSDPEAPAGPGSTRVSVVIPTLNEAANLPHVLARLPECIDELIIVDGRSTDDTIAVAKELRPDCRIILQNRKGKGNALACGFSAASGDIVVMLDADGSTDPGEIQSFVQPILDGEADFVKGSRYMQGAGSSDITFLRSAGNKVLGGFVNLLFGTRYTDLCYGYSAFRANCLPHLHITCDGFEVETLINVRAAKAGFVVVEVPSHEHERIHGTSNLSAWKDGRRVLMTILRERLSRLPEPTDAWRPQFGEMVESDPIRTALQMATF